MIKSIQNTNAPVEKDKGGRPHSGPPPDKRPDLSEESEVWNAIAAFERILEAIPTDPVALETLYEAYEQIGQKARAIEYLMRLAESVLELRDAAAAPGLIEKLRKVQPEDPAAGDLAERLDALIAEQPRRPASAHSGAEGRRKTIDITSELSLAWSLLQAGLFNQEQYSSIVQDLSESSSTNTSSPVSVLHVLFGREFRDLDKIIAHVAKESGAPVVSLASFEMQKTVFTLLPMDFMETRGAIVFDVMGAQDALVAILNPQDAGLRDDVNRLTARKCHFYVVSPDEYDLCLAQIRKIQQAPVEE